MLYHSEKVKRKGLKKWPADPVCDEPEEQHGPCEPLYLRICAKAVPMVCYQVFRPDHGSN